MPHFSMPSVSCGLTASVCHGRADSQTHGHAENILIFASSNRTFTANVVAMGVLFGIAFALNVTAIILPLFGGREMWSRHLWIARIKYHRDYRHPYLVPNGRLWASVFACISSARACLDSHHAKGSTDPTSAVMISIVVFILRAPDRLNAGLLLCPLIPLWLVGYMACFDALFVVWVCPISSHRSATDGFKHPWLLNTLCWLAPLGVVIAGSILTANLWGPSAALLVDGAQIVQALQAASAAYDAGTPVHLGPLTSIKQKTMCAAL